MAVLKLYWPYYSHRRRTVPHTLKKVITAVEEIKESMSGKVKFMSHAAEAKDLQYLFMEYMCVMAGRKGTLINRQLHGYTSWFVLQYYVFKIYFLGNAKSNKLDSNIWLELALAPRLSYDCFLQSSNLIN